MNWYLKCGPELFPPVFQRETFPLRVDPEEVLWRIADVSKGNGIAVSLAKTCKKQPHVGTKESSQDSLGPIPLVHLAPWDPPVFLREQKPRDRHPLNARCAKRAFFINLSLPCTRGHTQERGPFTATSVTKDSYSFQTCGFTSGSTQVRSPTAVISAPRGSPTTPRCALTRGPTPRRSPSAVSTVTELSATEGISTFTSAPTLGSSPTCAPSATAPSGSWGPSDATRKSIPDNRPGPHGQAQVLAAPRRKFRIICHVCDTMKGWHVKNLTIMLEPDGIAFTWVRQVSEGWLIFPFRFCFLL